MKTFEKHFIVQEYHKSLIRIEKILLNNNLNQENKISYIIIILKSLFKDLSYFFKITESQKLIIQKTNVNLNNTESMEFVFNSIIKNITSNINDIQFIEIKKMLNDNIYFYILKLYENFKIINYTNN